MMYELRYSRGAGTKSQIVNNPSFELIDYLIDELFPVINYYIVLSTDEKVDDCDCIQTVFRLVGEHDIEYQVELLFKHEVGRSFYRKYTTDRSEVKGFFRLFLMEIIPDLKEWDNVTEEVEATLHKRKK